jgi:broad specificity phosphatase PhoE
MTRIVLIRHAMPQIEEGVPAADWKLSPEGTAAATALAARLTRFEFAEIASSAEPKAVGTATAIAQALKLPVAIDDDFAETRRRTVGFLRREEIDAGIRRLFENPSEIVYGEESADAAHTRFALAIARLTTKGVSDIAVVTHGTILSVYASRVAPIADVFSFWKSLKLPDAILLDGRSVERLV